MKTAKTIILGAILCTTALTAVAQSACDPVEPPKGIWARMAYGAGQAATANAGLPTDQQIQQQRCAQEIQLQQLELQRQQLEMQRQAMELQQKAAEAQAEKANAEADQKPVIADAQCSNGVCVPKAATEPITPPVKTPAQICRDRGFNWYGYCADNQTTAGQK